MVHILGSNAHHFEKYDKGIRINVFDGVRKNFSILVFTTLLASASPTQATEQNIGLYEGYLYDSGYEIIDREGFGEFLRIFQPILEYLDTFILTGEDINNAMNLYSAWIQIEQDPDTFMDFYNYFLHSYSNPDIDIVTKLSEIGIIAIPLIAEAQQG